MARKDKRGVVIPAPLQFNNPASASLPRYDDEHRGPAVADAYELSRCRIDLAEHSEPWPLPENPSPTFVQLTRNFPEDQRADWLRRLANMDEADRLISDAIRSGDLPIWVAPIGEPERLVAPGALVEVDKATVVSGCYRPPNDRGWLYGRPLFVKKDDWVRFVAEIQKAKAKKQAAPDNCDSSSADAGQDTRISARTAIRTLYQRVKAAIPEADPAPWLEVSADAIEMWSEGNEASYVRKQKTQERTKLLLQRALRSGDLRAQFSDGTDSRAVPGWAWEGTERNEHVWFEGRLPLDVFLPDEWQHWSCQRVFFDNAAFTEWMDGQTLHDPAGLPALPQPYDAGSKPEPVKKRLPPDTPFVTLSEALSWIAFGFALDRDCLDRAISGHAFNATDPQAAMADAMAKLAVRASGGQIATRGKYVESHSAEENKVLTAPIDPVRFEDFAQFDILHDGLRYGTGLTWLHEPSALERVFQDRHDAFRSVKVNRADLLKLFPDQDDTARALFAPLPAVLPGIGSVMGLDEALSWLAHHKPSYDLGLWQATGGDLLFREPSGAIIEGRADGSLPPFLEAYRQASRTIHAALRNGDLPSYVAPSSGTPLLVPRFYWNGANPESLHRVYGGMTPGDPGAGCPLLLSRLAFDQWRAAFAFPRAEKINRAPSVKGGRPPSDDEILAKADEMKGRGLDGRTIAKEMRLEPGFENVATTAVRDLIKGRWKPAGRPKKAP